MAEAAKYTKGPWELTDSSDFEVRSYDHKLIASIVMMEAQTYNNERRQQKVNARLITAAPEMAEMLRGKVLAALRQPQAMDIEGVCEDVEELLKKAGVL
jgi:hypothetical protein